ncbi:MAG: serine/threonine-protein kinase, partial [Acidobacteria bacterium]|nr:serine/threonine-protein kinase [Acidobacteriota bacterium]
MTFSAGKRLGFYELLAPLGAGGIGEVYRALDTKLGREVALKVLPQELARDPERLARFEREARVLASLNHPNIAALYGFEQSDSVPFLVMELVEGEILKGPLPLDEALHLATQMTEALEAAHEKGVVHRDLKPANVKVTPEGKVKVLDFGLAKALAEEPAADPAQSPTISEAATRAGTILGTAAYMSPEQARGKTLDRRTDIWSFGCVLYELVTGRRAFSGENVADIFGAVVRAEPDWSALPAETPANVRRLLRRCLQKDPKQRLQHIGDARIEIEEALSGGAVEVAPPKPARQRQALPWVIATSLLAVLALALAVIHFRETPGQPQVAMLTLLPPEKTTFGAIAVSPDGHRIAFTATDSSGRTQLWVRPLDSLAAQPLAGTEGAIFPFWSADSRFIGFFAGGKLKKIEASGGPP